MGTLKTMPITTTISKAIMTNTTTTSTTTREHQLVGNSILSQLTATGMVLPDTVSRHQS